MSDSDGAAGSRQLVRAFLISPLAAPVAYEAVLVGMTLTGVVTRSGSTSLSSLGDLLAVVAAVGLPTAYAAAWLGGIPAYFILRRIGLITPVTLWIGGTIIGASTALLLAPHLRGELFSIRFPVWAGSLLGLLSAEVFRRLLSVGHTRGTEPNGSVAR
jgi:hypothetical protein